MPVLAVSCRQFAQTIAADSPDAVAEERVSGWQVTGERLVIDPVHCAQALGRPLLPHEREELWCRQTAHPAWSVSRLAGRVFLEPYQPSTSLTLCMPMGLGDAIKGEIDRHDLTVKDFVCLALRWYAATWSNGDPDLKAQVAAEYRDLHHWTGPRTKQGVIDERRWATHYEPRKGPTDDLVSDEKETGGGAVRHGGDAAAAEGDAPRSAGGLPRQGSPAGRRGDAGRTRGFLARLRTRRRPADAGGAALDGA